jgi:glycosyltransferase involved in cell wall biosynthesis
MEEHNWQLQPWRYLTEVACQLAARGHAVGVISDSAKGQTAVKLRGLVRVEHLRSVRNPIWKPNHALLDLIQHSRPDVLLWHVGLTSFVYQSLPARLSVPTIGVFSNPLYTPYDLARLGIAKLLRNHLYVRVHLAGSLIPARLLKARIQEWSLRALIVQTNTTRSALLQAGFFKELIRVIPPAIDEVWQVIDQRQAAAVRTSWGFAPDDRVVLYYGSPIELRGLPLLIRALVRTRQKSPGLKLVILSRRWPGQLVHEDLTIGRLLQEYDLVNHVKVLSGFLQPAELVPQVAAADIIALPFELLPSDAPLSILEALALGKPVVTTRVGCLPELVARGQGYLAEPGDVESLAQVLYQAAVATLGRHPAGIDSDRRWEDVGEEWSTYLQNL